MADLNVVTLTGRFTRDPTTKQAGGSTLAEFSIAVSDRVKRGTEWVDAPVFVDCIAWGKTADFVGEHFQKGAGCSLVGKLQLDQWDDKATGQKRSKMRVVAEKVNFNGSKPEGGQRRADTTKMKPAHAAAVNAQAPPDDDAEIPF